MRKAASTRDFLGSRFCRWPEELYAAAGQKASAERPAEMLLEGLPTEQWANRLRALSSALSRGKNEETRHRAGQIAELKAG
jgi:hypothetical protein